MLKEIHAKSLKYYLLFTFLLTFGTGVVLYFLGGLEDSPVLSGIITFFPAVVAIIVIMVIERQMRFSSLLKSIHFRLGKIKYMIIFPLFMFVIVAFSYLMTYVFVPDAFITISELPKRLSGISFGSESLPVPLKIISIFFINSVIGTIITIPVFLGEEIGWRSFLYPRLEQFFQKKGLIIGGVIWGVWHVPMILMGLNYPSFPILGSLVMILVTIPLGIILYYFYCKSGSIITAALCHGMVNQTASTFNMVFVDDKKFQPIIHGQTGIIGIFLLVVIAIFIYKRITREVLIKGYPEG